MLTNRDSGIRGLVCYSLTTVLPWQQQWSWRTQSLDLYSPSLDHVLTYPLVTGGS